MRSTMKPGKALAAMSAFARPDSQIIDRTLHGAVGVFCCAHAVVISVLIHCIPLLHALLMLTLKAVSGNMLALLHVPVPAHP
jgi:hypothetical protein